jgi:endoglucanase
MELSPIVRHGLSANRDQRVICRRQFLGEVAGTLAAMAVPSALKAAGESQPARMLPQPSPAKLPRWRGFNLLEKFNHNRNQPFLETDFEWIAELGFDFVRLPMSYRCWADPEEWRKLKEPGLREIDEAVKFGRKHGVHVNLNLHRAPGYCVNPPAEPRDLWTDQEALDACAFHWAHLAKRYQGIPNREVSFDLLNEPKDIPVATYVPVITRLVEAIREQDPERLIVADGLRWGNEPVPALVSLRVGQSTRGYQPFQLTHWKASWVSGSDRWPEPAWPLHPADKNEYNRERLRREQIEPWQRLAAQGVGVHVGEWGAYRFTPHPVVLSWMRDCLELWREAGWGWALWNFRGDFGVLDSQRGDVNYEHWRGHKLDRAMLDLLQSH